MEIGERLQLSESAAWLACFYEGMFVRFYDAHLGWFCQHGKALKVLRRGVKKLQGRVVLYGGIPQTAFEAWLTAQLPALEVQDQSWGVLLRIPGGMDLVELQRWCVAQREAATQLSAGAAPRVDAGGIPTLLFQQRQILTELQQVPLANCTPIQALQWLVRWQSLGCQSPQAESGGEG